MSLAHVAVMKEMAKFAKEALRDAMSCSWPVRFSVGFDADYDYRLGSIVMAAWAADLGKNEGYFSSEVIRPIDEPDPLVSINKCAANVASKLCEQLKFTPSCSPAEHS